MNILAFFRFFAMLMFAGTLMFVFNNVADMALEFSSVSTSDPYYIMLALIYHGVLVIVLFKESKRFLENVGKRSEL